MTHTNIKELTHNAPKIEYKALRRSLRRAGISRYVDGKRKYKTAYGKTQREANEKAELLKIKLGKGLCISDDSFEMWTKHYLVAKQTEVSENQYRLVASRAEYWLSVFGQIKITEIRPIDVQQALNALAEYNPHTGKPTSKRTLTSYMQILRAIFDYAQDNRVIEYNPAARTKIPGTEGQKDRRALTKEERHRIVEFEHRGKPAMILMMLSGLRRGEATALQWSDINFMQSTITVSKSYDFKSKSIKKP